MEQPTSDIVLMIPVSPIPFGQFRDEFLRVHGGIDASPRTTAKYRQVFGLLERLGLATTDQLTPDLIARLLENRPAGESPYTKLGILSHVRTACNYAEGRRYVNISPFRLRKLSRWVRAGRPRGKRHQSREEIRQVLDLMRRDVAAKLGWAQWRARRLYALTSVVVYTGLRAGEAQCLHAGDLLLDGGCFEGCCLDGAWINLVPRTAHGRLKTDASAEPVCVPAPLLPILRDWLSHRLDHPEGFEVPPPEQVPWLFPGSRRRGPWIGGQVCRRPVSRLKAAAKRAGVEGMTFQSLRRSWATLAEAIGVPQAMITRQCRHTSETTTRRWYQQRDLDNLHDAIEGFEI
jgi:integrase